MPRLKRGSEVVDKAANRCAKMKSISVTLEFGEGLSVAKYDARIQELQKDLSDYNMMLDQLDDMADKIKLQEQELRSYSEKMLMRVATRYGKDSLQYMQAGGTTRKRSTRRSSSATSTTPVTALSAEKAETNGSGTKVTLS